MGEARAGWSGVTGRDEGWGSGGSFSSGEGTVLASCVTGTEGEELGDGAEGRGTVGAAREIQGPRGGWRCTIRRESLCGGTQSVWAQGPRRHRRKDSEMGLIQGQRRTGPEIAVSELRGLKRARGTCTRRDASTLTETMKSARNNGVNCDAMCTLWIGSCLQTVPVRDNYFSTRVQTRSLLWN